jgi:hypothetical protein
MILDIVFFKVLLLLVWFKTDAFIVYSKLFRVNKLFNTINEWEIYKNTKDCSVGYHQFLRIRYPDNFWYKLITCPICLCIWLSFSTLILCGFAIFCKVCVLTLLLYFLITKLMQ